MPRSCRACSSPQRELVEAALAKKVPFRQAAERSVRPPQLLRDMHVIWKQRPAAKRSWHGRIPAHSAEPCARL